MDSDLLRILEIWTQTLWAWHNHRPLNFLSLCFIDDPIFIPYCIYYGIYIRKNPNGLFCTSEPFDSPWTECDRMDLNGAKFCIGSLQMVHHLAQDLLPMYYYSVILHKWNTIHGSISNWNIELVKVTEKLVVNINLQWPVLGLSFHSHALMQVLKMSLFSIL